MSALTVGDVYNQMIGITGARASQPTVQAAFLAAINAAHESLVLEAAALGLQWLHRRDVILRYEAGSAGVPLPDGATVQDANGAIPVACLQLRRVHCVGTGTPLIYRPRTTLEMESGGLLQHSVPELTYWDASGVDAQGRTLLWLMGFPSTAGTIAIDYMGGPVQLTSMTQQLIPPVGFRQIVADRAIVRVMSTASIDPVIAKRCEASAERAWRAAVALAIGPRQESQVMLMRGGV